ncbi:MAG: peptidoglycan DD-metalloendopeptidase family protein [Patescibacteria group bacterium]
MYTLMRVICVVAFVLMLSVGVANAQSSESFSVKSFQSPVAKNHPLNQGPNKDHNPEYSIDVGALNRGAWDDPVYAMAAGTVVFSGWDSSGYGNTVVLEHKDGWYSRYAHLSGFSTQSVTWEGGKARVKHEQNDATFVVKHGDSVTKGQLIGFMGSTGRSSGAHLHLEYYNSAENKDQRVVTMKKVTWWDNNTVYGAHVPDPACNDKSYSGIDFLRGKYCQNGSARFLNQVGDYDVGLTQVQSIYVGSGSVYVRPLDGSSGVCFNRSAWDLEKDYYPNGSRVANNIGYARLYSDTTCNGKVLSYVYEGGADSEPGTGGQTAPTQPVVTPAPPPESNPQNPSQHVVVFIETHYKNVYYELEPGHWDIEDREYRSISAPSGWSYVLVDRDGKQQCFNFSHHNMQDFSEWHVRIDSIAVFNSDVCTSTGQPEREPLSDWFARFWTDKDFWNWSLSIKFSGDENYYWINSVHSVTDPSMNDDIQSLEVNTNRGVAVYEHDNLQGGVKCFTRSDSNLWDDTFDNGVTVANQISSMRFFTRSECNLRPSTPPELWIHEAKRGSISITWVKSSPDRDGYHINMFKNGEWQRVATLSEDQARSNASSLGLDTTWIRAWTLNDVSCGENYTFAVSAYNNRAESYNSRQVTAIVECDCNDPTYNGVGLYDLRYCQGESVQLTEPGWFNLSQFNDKASSLYIKPGWSAELFENINNVDGLTTCVSESKWDLSYDNFWLKPIAMDNTLSNVRVWNMPNCGRTLPQAGCDGVTTNDITLFDYTHCLGRDKSFSAPGFYLLDDFDDLTSSIYVPDGKSARLYENQSKEGNFVCVNHTKWDMSHDIYWWDNLTNTFNNVSAVEIFNDGSNCGGVPTPTIIFPKADSLIMDTDYSLFRWENNYAGGYWAELWGPNGFFLPSGKLSRNEWSVGTLEKGQYTFRVLGDVNGVTSAFADMIFTVSGTTTNLEMSVSYSLDPEQINKATFNVTNCSGTQVSFVFGDGTENVAPCVNGSSSAVHAYPYSGEAITFNALVDDIAIAVNLHRSPDCGELAPTTGVRIFAEKDCRGDKREFDSAGIYALADFNDLTSAIVIAPNWSVEVFENHNSSDGHAYCVTTDIWDAGYENYYATQSLKLDNSISAIRVYNDRTCGKEFPQHGGCDANIVYDGVVLFDYINCGGTEQKFNEAGKYELGYGGPFNDLASSVRVAQGWSMMIYDTSGWQGNSHCIARDMWDFGIDTYEPTDSIISNTVSSVEVFNNSTCQAAQPIIVKPTTPTNLLPSGGIFDPNKPIVLKWNSVHGADEYLLEIILDSTASSHTLDIPEYTFTPQQEGSYNWRVKAIRTGVESDWSEKSLLTVKTQVDDTAPPPTDEQPSPRLFIPIITR